MESQQSQKKNSDESSDQAEIEEKLDILTFDGKITDHVRFLLDAPEQVFKDFCRLALDFLHNGLNEKRFGIAAEKFNTSVTNITNAVNGIVYLLMNGCKYNLNEKDFMATLTELKFSDKNKETLIKFLSAKKENIRRALLKFNIDLPMFHNLDWRLEAQVAKRSVPDQVIPSVLLNFSLVNYDFDRKRKRADESTDEDEEPKKIITHKLIECDIPNLENMIGSLETALRETKYYHAKKTKTAVTKE